VSGKVEELQRKRFVEKMSFDANYCFTVWYFIVFEIIQAVILTKFSVRKLSITGYFDIISLVRHMTH